MKITSYNLNQNKKNEKIFDIILTNIGKIEGDEYEKMPKQNELLKIFKEAGFEEKIKVEKSISHSIDGILGKVGLCIYVGHSSAAFLRLFAAQSLFLDKMIEECYFITQSQDTSEKRHREKNPNVGQGKNGNRITFQNLKSGMDSYHRFITVPITLIGLEI